MPELGDLRTDQEEEKKETQETKTTDPPKKTQAKPTLPKATETGKESAAAETNPVPKNAAEGDNDSDTDAEIEDEQQDEEED